jgi:mannose-6-phosphate isomerase-like protein (cupin superfamily)
MEPIALSTIREELAASDDLFVEFLRRESMSLEVYHLAAGSEDPQDPHTEDEVYYVLEGRAKIKIGEETHPVTAGDVVFVERGVEHNFFDIERDLTTLIFFAPARETGTEA